MVVRLPTHHERGYFGGPRDTFEISASQLALYTQRLKPELHKPTRLTSNTLSSEKADLVFVSENKTS